MEPLGPMTGDCSTIQLPGEIYKFKVSNEVEDMAIDYKVYGVLDEKYGDIHVPHTEWHFTSSNPLIGLYGRASELRIEEVGFITLNTECQATLAEDEISSEEIMPNDIVFEYKSSAEAIDM